MGQLMQPYVGSWRAVCTAAAVLVAACDTSVTNPGPTPDDLLDAAQAHQAVVVGARRALSDAINSNRGGFILYWSAALTFEINPAGSTGSFGILPNVQNGVANDTDTDGVAWDPANEARYTAEDAIRRFNEVGAAQARLAEVTLYAGYANRLMGEIFCEAVIPTQNPDGSLTPGGVSAHTDYFQRAEEHFTNALNLGTGAIASAARAGRASVRASLATYGLAAWSDAAADAAAITDNAFVFRAPYSGQDQNQYNALVWANGNSPYRAHTQWGTFAENYLLTTGDTRMRWRYPTATEPTTGDAAVGKFGGRVPWYPQTKYAAVADGVNLSSGWEMRLIQAEAALDGGNPGPAVDLMNLRRAALMLPLYDNTVSADSAWTLLKLERQVELWLEARRLGDIRRWSDNNVPGNLQDGLYQDLDGDPNEVNEARTETMFAPNARSLCFPVGRSEKETNPNVSL